MSLPKKERSDWTDTIILETDHYYQGEQRQEERSSWLLATTSAIIAIFTSGLFSLDATVTLNTWQIVLVSIMFVFLVLSAILALFGIIPLAGISFTNPFSAKKYFDKNKDQDIDTFGKKAFNVTDNWSEEEKAKWQLNHFQKHYLRNLKKSIYVIWSSIFLGLGLIFCIINVALLVFKS